MAFLLATGALSILTQVVLLREINAAFYGIELLYLFALAAWLLWTAAGAAATTRTPGARPARTIGLMCASLAPIILAEVAFLRSAHRLFGGVPGAYLPFGQQILTLVVALAPTGVLLGLMFQWSARRFVRTGRTLAQAYAIESTGALAAGVTATLLLRAGAQTFGLAVIAAAVAVATPLARPVWDRRRTAQAAAGALVVFFAVLVWRAEWIDRRLTRVQQPNLIDARDSPYARITVARLADQIAIFSNNALWFETQSPEPEVFAHLVALQHPAPARVLLLGGGPEGLARAFERHRPAALDDVELDAVAARLVERHVHAADDGLDVTSRVVFDDPRRFLRGGGTYDVIAVGMPDPDSGAANRFYTQEFFALCASRLTPGGILGLRLRTAENFWTPAQTLRVAGIYRALRRAFADVVVLPGAANVIVASQTPLARDADVLVGRLAARRLDTRVVTPAYLRYLYANDRRTTIARQLEQSAAAANTDIRPSAYEYAAVIWLGRFWPAVARLDLPGLSVDAPAGRTWRWIALAALIAAVVHARRRASRRRILLALLAGCAGMMIETVLLLHYQLKQGALFEDLGVLLAAFMGGLAAGAPAAAWFGVIRDSVGARRDVARWWGATMATGFVLLTVAVGLLVRGGIAGGLPWVALQLAAAGFFVAALFAYASLQQVSDQQAVISPLYAADLAGGCLGSIGPTLVLIPLAGLAVTSDWTAVVAGLTLLLI